MPDDLPQHIPFLSFKTKQNVSKSKLGGAFAKKGWNDFSKGFSDETSFLKGEEPIEKKPKIDPEELRKQILIKGYKTKQRKPVIEHKEADFFTSKANDFCSLIQKKTLKAVNQYDLKTRNFNSCSNSVFLEVQNIQNSFQESKSISINNKSTKFCSKYSNRNFIADLAVKNAGGQENVPTKSGHLFSFQENDFSQLSSIKKVQKTNVFSSLAKRNVTVTNNSSELISNYSYSKNNHNRSKSSDYENFKKELLTDQNQNKCVSVNLSALLEDESSKNKGSNWLQSLQISDGEVAPDDSVGKKRIRNILPGGFAEQMLKLQRIEKSEEVIWDHNADRNRKKMKYLPLLLISASITGGIVIAKCCTFATESELQRDVLESDEVSTESKQVVVLLKRSVFHKLHLRAQSVFHLYPPWQTLHLSQISCPVILCAKFIDLNSCKDDVTQDNILYSHPMSTSSTSASHQTSNCFNDIFYQWQQPISLSGRVQRVWKFQTDKNVFPLTSTLNYIRYSLLLQEQNGVFYEVLLSPTNSLTSFWEQFISEAEGKCYEFHDLHVIRRFSLNKHPQFFKVLNLLSMSNDNGNGFKQEFCYQLSFPSPVIPEAVSDERFPAYCPVSLQPISNLFREKNIDRFTCICKIIFQFRKTLYLCDDSVPKYVKLDSLFPIQSKNTLINSFVLIRDAQWLEGCLFLDEYSSFTEISEEFQGEESFKQLLLNRIKQISNITLQNVIPPINNASENNSMFVFIKGEVIGVDANNALSWLQCNLCLSDNLVQDSQLVIYCENCFQVVPKPILNVKMSVTCQCSSNVKVELELLSRTVKRILQIEDNIHQPQCNVDDIVGKHIGPLLCYIRSAATIGDWKQFCASEVDER